MAWNKKKEFKLKTSHMSLHHARAMADMCFGLQHFH